jgi:predicted CoA-binding protein
MQKHTLVLGASLNENRFSNISIRTLASSNIPVVAIGLREGMVGNISIQTDTTAINNIHTVSLYLGPQNQKAWYDYLLDLKPVRVIFNPGTENREFQALLTNAGIDVVEDCTIMMIQNNRY